MVEKNIWDSVLEQTKTAQEKGSDPFLWAIQLSSNLSAAGVSLPSTELAHALVSYICWDNNVPAAWKFLERALMINMVPPLLVIALLSTRFCLPFVFIYDSVFWVILIFSAPCFCVLWVYGRYFVSIS